MCDAPLEQVCFWEVPLQLWGMDTDPALLLQEHNLPLAATEFIQLSVGVFSVLKLLLQSLLTFSKRSV